MGGRVRINEKYPIKVADQLSPPIVGSPIHRCAEIVSVSGYIPHAVIRVYANQTELIGEDSPPFGFCEIRLQRPLKLGEAITATQTVDGLTSKPSIHPVVVTAYEGAGGLARPVVASDLYECGELVPVGELVPSVTVHVREDGSEIGSASASGTGANVFTKPLDANRKVTAIQLLCEKLENPAKSPESDPVVVKPAPDPVPAPQIDPGSLIVGNDAVTLWGLYCGALVSVFDLGTSVGAGYATGTGNWCPIDPPLHASSSITATQRLCQVSPPSTPATPEGKLTAPVVAGPICAGAHFVVVRGTIINANVAVLRNGHVIGYGGAVPGDLILALGGAALQAGDVITAVQTMGATASPVSNQVTVVASLAKPSVEITGGEPFFLPESTDQAIDGPVFPRGRGAGPRITIQACCTKDVTIAILGPDGEVVAHPALTEVFPGYYVARWDWSSLHGWAVPDGIPIGAYTALVKTGCEQKETRSRFYVIFDPAEVNGPPRFSFNKTAVWFYSPVNQDVSLLYYLHTNDARVFGMAMTTASGMTDPIKAAEALSKAVHARFIYSISVSYNDVIDLLEHATEAQCADEACCLVALLRSIGVPSHPVTADADYENGGIHWGFDTWTEFLARGTGGPEWLVLHPHEYPADPAMSRTTFGTTKGVALNSTDDLILMANENWVWNEVADGTWDVRFERNPCKAPQQQLDAKGWVDHLCEQGYWDRPHWYCPGDRSLERDRFGLRFEGSRLRYGGMLSGTVSVRNPGAALRSGPFTVELVMHRRETKGLVSEVLASQATRVLIEPDREVSVPFRIQLPESLPPGHDLYLRAGFSEGAVLFRPVRLPVILESALRVPREVRVGEVFNVTATIRNVGHEAVSGIGVMLRTPYAIQAIDRPPLIGHPTAPHSFEPIRPIARIERLPPASEQTLTWRAHAPASLEAGTIFLDVTSDNGGPCQAIAPIRVLGPGRPMVPASPVRPPRRA